MPDPKTKRVSKRNMRDPLAPSSFDQFKKVVIKKESPGGKITKKKKTFEVETGVAKKTNIKKASPGGKITSKATRKKEMRKADQIRIKKSLGKAKKGNLTGSGKKALKKK